MTTRKTNLTRIIDAIVKASEVKDEDNFRAFIAFTLGALNVQDNNSAVAVIEEELKECRYSKNYTVM